LWTFTRTDFKKSSDGGLTPAGRNPARGFYHVYTYDLCVQEAEEDWIWSLQRQETLALVILDIGGAGARPLSGAELKKASRVCTLFAENGMQMIVRPLYDRQGQGMQREPETLALVQTHMRQLLPVIRAFSDCILTVQGLFIGSWGEMHSSRYLDEDSLRTLYGTMRRELGDGISISVRKPQFQRLFADGKGRICTGLYDDAILGSDTDMGTFGWIAERKPGIMWTPELELDFIRQEHARVVCGGELLAAASVYSRREILARMRTMGLTYLNAVHEPAVWEYLGNLYADGQSVSCREEIGRLLGYCYEVCDAQWSAGGMKVVIKNEGFTCCYDSLRLELTAGECKQCVAIDGKNLPAGGQICVQFPIKLREPDGEAHLPVRLCVFHEKTGMPVFFAQDYLAASAAFFEERYRCSSSFEEGMLLGVLSTVNAAT
jgi:hypothetical protein